MEAQLAKIADRAKDDPWCLGVFVDNELGWDGCGADVAEVAEKYYSTVREALKRHLPNYLYLGSRIHDDFPPEVQETVRRAAARHCAYLFGSYGDGGGDVPAAPLLRRYAIAGRRLIWYCRGK